MADNVIDDAAVAAAWDQNAEQWASDVRAGFDLYRELYTLPAFLEFMPPIYGQAVIDLGCGEGANTRRFARMGARMTGIDISEEMIKRAQDQEEREPLGVRFLNTSFTDLSAFSPESFDCALSTMALMDGPDFEKAMGETHCVLKSGGTLCFSVLHPCFVTPLFEWLKSADGDYVGIRAGGYFDTKPFVEHWRFSKRPSPDTVEPFTVPRFPRSLSDYMNAVTAAGFRLTKIGEPRPDAAASSKHPWLKRWYDHVPLVLFVSAVKS